MPEYQDYNLLGCIVEKQYGIVAGTSESVRWGWEAGREIEELPSIPPGHLPPGISWPHPWPHVPFIFNCVWHLYHLQLGKLGTGLGLS